MINYIYDKVLDQITFLSPNFNGCTFQVWKRIGNLIPHLTGCVITYPCLDQRQIMLVKGAPDTYG